MKNVPASVKVSFMVWAGCVFIFFVVTLIGTSGFKEEVVRYDRILGVNEILGIPMGVSIIVGIVSFIIFLISSIKFLIKKHKKVHPLVKVLRLVLITALLPIFLVREILKPINILKRFKDKDFVFEKSILIDLGFTALLILFLIPLWGSGYFVTGYIPAYMAGFISEPIAIAGTGSMYPTFPKGTKGKTPKELGKETVGTPGMFPYPNGFLIFDKRLFGHEIGRGDIIVVENEKIRESTKKIYGEPSGLVKRVIALPGETILIKDGLVYIDGKILKESYVAKPRSTFGGEFLRDCNELKIPEGKLFIMGDNRKGSGDSRHDTGLIDYKDVQYVLPFKDQIGSLDKGWHDPKDDDKESARITLNTDKYIELLNKQRADSGLKPLKYENRLSLSAEKRGGVILEYDDLSFEATRSGYTMLKAMSDSGYSNIIYGELPTLGAYEAEELFEQDFEFPEVKEFLLNKDYQDIGIATVKGDLNGCPADVIVVHVAGYIPPNYTKSAIESWEKALNDLRGVQPGWQQLKENTSFYNKYKSDIDKINDLISLRVSKLEAVVSTMKANRWLSSDLDRFTETGDDALFNEIDSLANKLNNSN